MELKTDQTKSDPCVSVLIPTYNEEGFIIDCLESVFKGHYSTDKLEVLVIDGGSLDKTRQFVTQYSKEYPQVRLIENPNKIVPAALNLGIKESRHDILLWLGAHAHYDVNYIKHSVATLLKEDAASVGGVIQPVGKSLMGKAIATATSNKFGIGNAKYRYATKKQSVDTVFGGCWKKKTVITVGGFNENWARNQDYEFNVRLRENAGIIILDPSIRCSYYCRESIKELANQYFQYGYWRFKTTKRHPKSFTVRQAAPLVLLMGLMLSLIICVFSLALGLIIPLLYLILNIAISMYCSWKNNNVYYLALLPLIFPTLHLAWAVGFVRGAVDDALNVE